MKLHTGASMNIRILFGDLSIKIPVNGLRIITIM